MYPISTGAVKLSEENEFTTRPAVAFSTSIVGSNVVVYEPLAFTCPVALNTML